MNLRLELLGRVFYLEWTRAEDPEPAAEPIVIDNMPQPIAVYPDRPDEPLGFHPGGLEAQAADTRGTQKLLSGRQPHP